MADGDTPTAAMVPPGGGDSSWIGGEHITFRLRSADTSGAFAFIEDEVEPGYGPPPHLHVRENELFHVVSGEFTITLDDRTVPAPAGSVFIVPMGQVHAFRNVGEGRGRLTAVIWPATEFEGFVAAAGRRDQPTGPPDLDRLLAAATAHGIVIPPPPAE